MSRSARPAAARRLRAPPPAESIVALTPVANDPQRVRIMVRAPGKSRARSVGVILREQAQHLRIRMGGRWSDTLAARIAKVGEVAAAREHALQAIAACRSVTPPRAIAAQLARRGHAPHAVRAALRQLRSDGWISE